MTHADVYLAPAFTRFCDWSCSDLEGNAPLHVGLGRESGGPVLEVAGGRGRLLIPLVREDVEVLGTYLCQRMLAIAARAWKKP